MAATPDGGGYWLVARDGGVFGYGDAGFFGSAGSLALNAPVVGMAATPDGGGYWLVAADGGIFSYGDARFCGLGRVAHPQRAGRRAWRPPPTAAATGSWGRDGGVFTYGDAVFSGSAGVGPAQRADRRHGGGPGGGYWLVARDGGLFSYGGAPYFGSLGGTTLPGPVVGMAAAPAGGGYWLALGSEPLAGKVVGIDPGHNGLDGSAPAVIDQPVFNGAGLRAVRHDGHGDRRRVHRGAVQLQRRHGPGGRPGGTRAPGSC